MSTKQPCLDYAELHCLSNFSFLHGASHPEELVLTAAKLGYRAIAITDECSLAGVVRAHEAALECEMHLIIGAQFHIHDGGRLILLACDRDGYGRLSQLITLARRRMGKGRYRLYRADLADGVHGCLAIVPSGQRPGEVGHGQDSGRGFAVPSMPSAEYLDFIAGSFADAAWLAVERHLLADDSQRLRMLQALAQGSGLPLLAAGDVHMHVRGRRALHDTLTAIRIGKPIAEAVHALFPNAEHHLRSLRQLQRLYPADLLARTIEVAQRCRFSLRELRYEYPVELVPLGTTAALHLRRLTEQGARRRFVEGIPDCVRAQVEHELALIAQLDYEPYFLTVHDIVRFARGRGILCQGRGSAANSAVCFCLGITEVDPARISMLFERFLSKERDEPPDIDVDFEHERREEVIQYLYRKYGRHRAALTATVISYQPRSAIRDVGKALGLEPAQVDGLARSMAWWDGRKVLPERLRELGLDPEAAVMKRLAVLLAQIIGFPRHLSQHTGGFVIARDRIDALVPVENAAMPERTVIQWDKDDLESLGLLKIDVLALGMLSAIRRTFDLIEGVRGTRWSMASIPAEDPDVYRMITRADTVGVFQIESRAQMAMLPRMRPVCFYDLVIEVAIVRPGPIQGGMVHPYLRRRQGLEAVEYPSAAVRGVLERTLGVPIFQEQAMQLAVVAAGFTPGEADRLRRAMAAFRKRGSLGPFEVRLIEGMLARGYDEGFARQVFQQIEGFGEYGFPESHSASFALLVYVSAWLKCHEPAAFTAALLNSQPMGFYAPAQLLRDARDHGVQVLPVDVLVSAWDCTLEGANEPALRLGLRLIKGLSRDSAERVEAARDARTTSVQGLAREARLSLAELRCLDRAGALVNLAGNRRKARWASLAVEASDETAGNLLSDACVREGQPLLRAPSEADDLVADYETLGLSLGRHPLALLRGALTRQGWLSAAEVRATRHGQPMRAAGLVINRQRPSTASGVMFLTLEDEHGQINLVLWPSVAARQRQVALGARLLAVHGHIEREGEVIHLVAKRLTDLSALLGRLPTRSRDFR
ncbi:MAG: error-prone DNA polymerase [Gammaproteobacteria bacterium]|jgi:error-prone DNA polymerase